jgi:hypothetical protein
MKLGNFVRRVRIDPRKFTEYALNTSHPRGQHKARRFREMLGFTAGNFAGLQAQIESSALDGEAIPGVSDDHGQRYAVDLIIAGANGKQAIVRTGWIVPPDSDEAYLTTMFVRSSP